jgi:MoaA/NifB/PqqE/SkfB family radical SAM enzyme/membrane protein YqaA with SNARE-associated domain
MESKPQRQFDVMTPKVYAFGAAMVIIGAAGIYLMAAKSNVYPLLTIFLYSIPSNCAISIFPHEPVLVWYGKFVNLWHLTTAATLGTIAAAYLDYKFFTPILNLSYSAKFKSHRFYQQAHRLFYKMPFMAIVIAGFTPIPFYPFKFMVYASKYSIWRYLGAVTIGRFPRYYLLALLGFTFQIPNWLIIAAFAGMFAAVYYRKIFKLVSRPFIWLYDLVTGKPSKAKENMPKNISTVMAIRIATRTIKNLILQKPICVALEVTHNCTANCRHCDKGPTVEDNAVGAEEYKRICDKLSPSMIQIAGGEPMRRKDLPEIVRALYRPDRTPILILITNASLLTRDNYFELREAGIKQFSISLDFPDERHDANRRVPGLFNRINRLVPELLSYGHGDVTINSCITRENYPYVKDLARLVGSWGAKLNFSIYTDLRTHNNEFNLRHPEDTEKLNAIIDEIYDRRNDYHAVMTSEKVFRRYCYFYENNCDIPNCRAGRRFLVINPDGRLTPCAMFIDERYDSREELIEKFADVTDCGGCYISVRANTEKSAWELFTDNLRALRLSNQNGSKSTEISFSETPEDKESTEELPALKKAL